MTAYEHSEPPDSEKQPGASAAPTPPTPPGVPSRYPRRRVFRVVRPVLLILGWYLLISWVGFVIIDYERITRHGIAAIPRFFSGPGAPDHLLWSYVINFAFFLLLVFGTLWATYDTIAEKRAEPPKPRVAFAVQAEQRWRRDLETARARGDRRGEYIALGNLGFWLARQDKDVAAREYLTQSLAGAREVGDRQREYRDLLSLGRIAQRAYELDLAENLLRESWNIACAFESTEPLEVADMSAILGEFLGRARGKREEARQLVEDAQRRYHTIGDEKDEHRMRDLLRQLGNDRAGGPELESS